MKYNLENRPKYEEKMHSKSWALNDVECWFVGFEAELREIDKAWERNVPKVHPDVVVYIRHMIREILGE